MCRLFYKNQHNVSNSSKHNILLRQAGKEVGFKELFLIYTQFSHKMEIFRIVWSIPWGPLWAPKPSNWKHEENAKYLSRIQDIMVFVFTPKCRINMNDFIFVSAKSKNYVRGETEWIDFYYIIINSLWFVSLYIFHLQSFWNKHTLYLQRKWNDSNQHRKHF